MNCRGERFIKNLDIDSVYRSLFANCVELGDIFQYICKDRYEDYKSGYSYDEFYRSVKLRLITEDIISEDRYGCSNLSFSLENLRKAIRALDLMYPPKKKINTGSMYYFTLHCSPNDNIHET